MASKIAMICPHCHRIVPPRQTCPCRPPRVFKTRSERLKAEPHRAEYDTQAYKRERQATIERQRGRCAGCGAEIFVKKDGVWKAKPGAGTNHTVKLKHQGKSTKDDLTALCRKCHAKADRED